LKIRILKFVFPKIILYVWSTNQKFNTIQTKIDESPGLKQSKAVMNSTSELFTYQVVRNTFRKVVIDWYSSEMAVDELERKRVGKCYLQLAEQ
jgi:hypothetical protein